MCEMIMFSFFKKKKGGGGCRAWKGRWDGLFVYGQYY